MATYQELFDLQRSQVLLDKITVAVIVAANTIFAEAGGTANHANRVIWAREASIKPRAMAEVFMASILAKNSTFTIAQITNAADAAIQANVDATVDSFANGSAVLG